MAKASSYYGGIINLKTGEEYIWEETSELEMINDLKKLQGTEYGVHWKFAGDTGLEESDIYNAGWFCSYVGTTAIADLARDLKVEI